MYKSCSIQKIRNQSENDYILQEPGNLRFAPVIIFYLYFPFLLDIIDNIIRFLVCIVRIMSPELSPMAVQYHCHVSQSVSCDQYTALSLVEDLVM